MILCTRPLAAAAALLALAAPLAAAPFTYADFEASVPHIDLETCPEGMVEPTQQATVFCRVSLNNDALHVFVFALEGDQEFVALRSYYEDEFTLTLGD